MAENFELSTIAERYSKALLNIADQNQSFDKVFVDLKLIRETVGNSEELKSFLEHPLVNKIDKKETLDKVFDSRVDESVLRLVKVLTDRNRMFIFSSIVDCYEKLLAEMRKLRTAKVITAVSIDEFVLENLKTKLETSLKYKIKLEHSIDSNIIAGMIVRIGDKVFDGSVKNKLETMKKQLV